MTFICLRKGSISSQRSRRTARKQQIGTLRTPDAHPIGFVMIGFTLQVIAQRRIVMSDGSRHKKTARRHPRLQQDILMWPVGGREGPLMSLGCNWRRTHWMSSKGWTSSTWHGSWGCSTGGNKSARKDLVGEATNFPPEEKQEIWSQDTQIYSLIKLYTHSWSFCTFPKIYLL